MNVGVSESIEDPIIPGYEVCNDFCHIAVKHLIRLRSVVFWNTDPVRIHTILLGKLVREI